MQIRQFSEKTIIFREGDPGLEAYIVNSGKIEILKHAEHGEVQLAVIGPGGVFGEMAFFDPEGGRNATARVVEDCILRELTEDDFRRLVECCPTELLPFIQSMIARLKALNVRVVSQERATVLLDTEINSITIEGTGALKNKFATLKIQTANLPFTIGGYLEDDKPGKQMLSLPCKPDPQFISNHHCNIELIDKDIFLVEQGSLFRTIINNQEIGRGRPSFKAPLIKGENNALLGGFSSPYGLKIICE